MAATASLECSICLLPYDNEDHAPLGLLCGHTCCKKCVDAIQLSKKHIHCPFCKRVYNSKYTPSKNFALLSVIEDALKQDAEKTASRSFTNDQEELFKTAKTALCSYCNKTDSHAVCMQCETNYCEACWHVVHRVGILKNHEMFLVEHVGFRPCRYHSMRLASFTCICSDGTVTFLCQHCRKHKDHSGKHFVVFNRDFIHRVDNRVRSRFEEHKRARKDCLRNLETLRNTAHEQHNYALKAVLKYYNDAIERIVDRKEECAESMARLLVEKEEAYDEQFKHIQKVHKDYRRYVGEVETLLYAEGGDVFAAAEAFVDICPPKYQLKSEHYAGELDEFSGYATYSTYNFLVDQQQRLLDTEKDVAGKIVWSGCFVPCSVGTSTCITNGFIDNRGVTWRISVTLNAGNTRAEAHVVASSDAREACCIINVLRINDNKYQDAINGESSRTSDGTLRVYRNILPKGCRPVKKDGFISISLSGVVVYSRKE